MKREDILKQFARLKIEHAYRRLKVELYRRPAYMLNQDGMDTLENFLTAEAEFETFVEDTFQPFIREHALVLVLLTHGKDIELREEEQHIISDWVLGRKVTIAELETEVAAIQNRP